MDRYQVTSRRYKVTDALTGKTHYAGQELLTVPPPLGSTFRLISHDRVFTAVQFHKSVFGLSVKGYSRGDQTYAAFDDVEWFYGPVSEQVRS